MNTVTPLDKYWFQNGWQANFSCHDNIQDNYHRK